MLMADKPTTPTKLATEQTDAVMKIAFMARRLTSRVSDPAPLASGMKQRGHRGVRCTRFVGHIGLHSMVVKGTPANSAIRSKTHLDTAPQDAPTIDKGRAI
jgi:hypothetical protein